MNKQILAALAAAGLVLSSSFALGAQAVSGNVTVGNAASTADNTDCELLSEIVTLGVSTKVHGAYFCDEATNLVQVAACHEGGSRKGVSCTDTDTVTAGDQLPAGCTVADGSTSATPSYKSFFASSAGGVMAEIPLDGRCSATTIVGIDGFSG